MTPAIAGQRILSPYLAKIADALHRDRRMNLAATGQDLSRSARRVQEALARLGRSLNVVELPQSTRSAREAALAVGCVVGQIAKSLVFQTEFSRQAILVIASGANRG